jgi:hypothetical protein
MQLNWPMVREPRAVLQHLVIKIIDFLLIARIFNTAPLIRLRSDSAIRRDFDEWIQRRPWIHILRHVFHNLASAP